MKKWSGILGAFLIIYLIVLLGALMAHSDRSVTVNAGVHQTEIPAETSSEALNEAEVTTEPEATTEPERTTEPEATTVSESTTEPEGATEPKGTTEPEETTEREATTEEEPSPETQPVPGSGDLPTAPDTPAVSVFWEGMSEQELVAQGKVIYLTFDDGPGAHTSELLDILAKYGVKATFFVTGTFSKYYDMIARESEEGHTIGIHSFSHDYKQIYVSEEVYFADLTKIDDIVFEQTGSRAQLVRFPGGSSNTISRYNPGIMSRLAGLLTENGYHYYDWNVVSGDAGDTKDTDQIVQNVIDGVSRKGIAVVLQHDLYDYSIAAVERIIQWGLENGYAFLPLTMDSPIVHHTIAN